MSTALVELLKGRAQLKEGKAVLMPLLNKYYRERDDKARRAFDHVVMDVRPKPDRHDFKFHPSSIGPDFCGRAWVIEQHELVTLDDENITSELARIFDVGNYFHMMLQMALADMGLLYGRWRCTINDAHEYWGRVRNSGRCTECAAPMFYAEVPIEYDPEAILGHQDGEILFKDRLERWGIEIKSMNSRVYAGTVAEPLAKHKTQASLYGHVRTRADGRMKHLGEPKWIEKYEYQGMILLYINKDTCAMREHVVRWTDHLQQYDVEPVLEQIELARRFVPEQLDTLPPRVCGSASEGEMRKCPFADACFRQFPPVVKDTRRKKRRK